MPLSSHESHTTRLFTAHYPAPSLRKPATTPSTQRVLSKESILGTSKAEPFPGMTTSTAVKLNAAPTQRRRSRAQSVAKPDMKGPTERCEYPSSPILSCWVCLLTSCRFRLRRTRVEVLVQCRAEAEADQRRQQCCCYA